MPSELHLQSLAVAFDAAHKRVTIVRPESEESISLTARELDAICHWAMGKELLPALMAEIRGLIRTGGTR